MNKHQCEIGIEKLPTAFDVFAEFGKIMFELKDFNKSEDMGALIVRELTERVIKHVKLSVKNKGVFTELNSLWINRAQYDVCSSLSYAGEQKKTCDCVLVGSVDTQQDGVSCMVSGCNQNSDSYFKEILDQRQKEIEYLKNNEDWQLAAPLGELILIAPEMNSLLMKALEERGVKPTPYHIHTLATLIQQLSGAAL